LEDFVRTIQTGATPRVTAVDGRQSLAIAVAANESHRKRRTVTVAGVQSAGAA